MLLLSSPIILVAIISSALVVICRPIESTSFNLSHKRILSDSLPFSKKSLEPEILPEPNPMTGSDATDLAFLDDDLSQTPPLTLSDPSSLWIADTQYCPPSAYGGDGYCSLTPFVKDMFDNDGQPSILLPGSPPTDKKPEVDPLGLDNDDLIQELLNPEPEFIPKDSPENPPNDSPQITPDTAQQAPPINCMEPWYDD